MSAGAHPPGESVRYVPVSAEEVSPETRAAAEGMHRAACEDLLLPEMALRWFAEETPEEAAERRVWVEEKITSYELPETTAKEAAVVWRVAEREATLERETPERPARIIGEPAGGRVAAGLNGCYIQHRRTEVWVKADLSPERAAHVAAHELYHAFCHRRFPPVEEMAGHDPENPPDLHNFYESRCERYAAYALSRLEWRPAAA